MSLVVCGRQCHTQWNRRPCQLMGQPSIPSCDICGRPEEAVQGLEECREHHRASDLIGEKPINIFARALHCGLNLLQRCSDLEWSTELIDEGGYKFLFLDPIGLGR